VLLGVTPAARERVHGLRAEGRLRRRYVALAARTPATENGSWSSRIGRAAGGRRRQSTGDGKPSLTLFHVAGTSAVSGASALALEPRTGRTHQLRVQASENGAPFFGDPTYGGPRQLVLPNGAVHPLPRVFLHAAWLEVEPGQRVQSPFPDDFTELWRTLAGDPAVLERAREIELGKGA
jgi:tRNA pseudouridine32 synthase/23S rRNA pseudouridine746 synthase